MYSNFNSLLGDARESRKRLATDLVQGSGEWMLVNDLGKNILHLAAEHDDLELLDAALECLQTKQNQHDAERSVVNGRFFPTLRTPLMIAAASGNVDMNERLLANGADPFCVDENDRTALAIAVINKNVLVVDLYIEMAFACFPDRARIWLQMSDRNGDTVLHLACLLNCVPCARSLLKAGANISAQDNFGRNPFDIAIVNDARGELTDDFDRRIASMTPHDRLAFVSQTGKPFQTSLRNACRLGNCAAVRLLFRHGADVEQDVGSALPINEICVIAANPEVTSLVFAELLRKREERRAITLST